MPDSPLPGVPEEHLIHVEDQEVSIENHPEDWLAFVLFWALAGIVFLQFFTRYVLNDSLAWTEEIARYGLMWLTFIGGIVVVRKRSHIAVEALLHFLPRATARWLLAVIDTVKLVFMALLALFAWQITQAMHWQRMVIIDLPMSVVYGGIAIGCFAMLAREALGFWRNARDGWRSAAAQIGEGLVID
ncbi:MAG: TRAP transporter small permease [Hyphomicrobiaceae bacterium]|jgi:TRAP-type C4-dicarboxylate transport system permease small subunit